jgi:hypothetical protein
MAIWLLDTSISAETTIFIAQPKMLVSLLELKYLHVSRLSAAFAKVDGTSTAFSVTNDGQFADYIQGIRGGSLYSSSVICCYGDCCCG